jgi:cell division control protein 45
MWVSVDNFTKAFDTIKADCHENLIGITVLVGYDCDAICGLRILTRLFDRYFMQFRSVPVNGWARIQQFLEKEKDREMSWVLLNCGASEDLTQWANRENHRIYVIDNHRPVHIANIESDWIRVFDDGQTIDEVHRMFGIGKPKSNKRRKRSSGNEEGDVAALEADSSAGEEDSTDESFVQDEDGNTTRKRKRIDKGNEREYYRASRHAQSTSVILYMIADQLNHSDKEDVLWMAVCGLTEHFIFGKLSKDMYREQMFCFQQHVNDRLLKKPTQTKFLDGFTAPKYNEGRIVTDDEYRFVLLRHWSLYDSMWHSQYVVSRLGLYFSDKGKLALDTLLSKVGLSPQLRKAPFTAIPTADQKSLKAKLAQYGRSFGLKDFTYRSFFKYQGYGFSLSAADVVHCVNALLEQPAESAGESRSHFWNAYDALQSDSMFDVKDGIELAKIQQEALVRQATILLLKNALVNTGPFRHGSLPETTDSNDLQYLVRPVILTRMARFLLDVKLAQLSTSSSTSKGNSKPLVLAAFNTKTEYWLIVGVHPEKLDGTIERNKFYSAFKSAAARSRANVIADGFEPNCIEVHRDSKNKFIDALHYGMLEESGFT